MFMISSLIRSDHWVEPKLTFPTTS